MPATPSLVGDGRSRRASPCLVENLSPLTTATTGAGGNPRARARRGLRPRWLQKKPPLRAPDGRCQALAASCPPMPAPISSFPCRVNFQGSWPRELDQRRCRGWERIPSARSAIFVDPSPRLPLRRHSRAARGPKGPMPGGSRAASCTIARVTAAIFADGKPLHPHRLHRVGYPPPSSRSLFPRSFRRAATGFDDRQLLAMTVTVAGRTRTEKARPLPGQGPRRRAPAAFNLKSPRARSFTPAGPRS